MSSNDILLTLVAVTALAFDFTNGFHDTGNAMATSIATGALPPRIAVALSGVLNLVGAFLSFSVAATIASGLVQTHQIDLRGLHLTTVVEHSVLADADPDVKNTLADPERVRPSLLGAPRLEAPRSEMVRSVRRSRRCPGT